MCSHHTDRVPVSRSCIPPSSLMMMILNIKLFGMKCSSLSSRRTHLIYFLADLTTGHKTFYICKFSLFKQAIVKFLVRILITVNERTFVIQ